MHLSKSPTLGLKGYGRGWGDGVEGVGVEGGGGGGGGGAIFINIANEYPGNEFGFVF